MEICSYVYDKEGNVAKKTDIQADVTTLYEYNDAGLLVRSEAYKGTDTKSEDFESKMQYTYTQTGKVGTLSYMEKDKGVKTYTYTYTKDDKPLKSTLPDKSVTDWTYDSLRRNIKSIYTPKSGAADSKKLYTTLTYAEPRGMLLDEKDTTNYTTNRVDKYTNKFGSTGKAVSEFTYCYDKLGNITQIVDISGYTRDYTYNDYFEIEKAEETYSDGSTKQYGYTYDNGGNIKTETVDGTVHTYTYDSVWKDKLISYDGKEITYNDMGAPVNYMGAKFTWDVKGNLTDIKKGNDTISYTYMSDGKRRSRNVNGKITEYHYNNGMLLSETTGDETLHYYYDSTGKVTSIGFKKGEEEERSYFFTRNVQGDIIAVYRNSDSKLIGTYEYDLWGKPVLTKEAEEGIDTDNILTKNPYRYRGYYYDNETGYYNLPARFYDPQIRRFINADSISALMIATTDVGCKNLFVYAENNPVTGKDGSGAFIDTVFDVISLAGSIVDVCKNPTDSLAWIGLTGDVVDLIPGVSGVGEGAKALCGMAKVADTAKDVAKATEAGVDATKGAAKAVVKEFKQGPSVPIVHGNSKLSTKSQHGYEIFNKETGDVVKTGISGQKLNLNGTSPRANIQVNALNRSVGTDLYDSRIVMKDMPNRASALEWEKGNAMRLWNEKNSMSIHKRPRPWEK